MFKNDMTNSRSWWHLKVGRFITRLVQTTDAQGRHCLPCLLLISTLCYLAIRKYETKIAEWASDVGDVSKNSSICQNELKAFIVAVFILFLFKTSQPNSKTLPHSPLMHLLQIFWSFLIPVSVAIVIHFARWCQVHDALGKAALFTLGPGLNQLNDKHQKQGYK